MPCFSSAVLEKFYLTSSWKSTQENTGDTENCLHQANGPCSCQPELNSDPFLRCLGTLYCGSCFSHEN